MSNTTRETIYALSSGRPPAAIAVVRISGPRAGDALSALVGRIPDPRKAALARVRGCDGEIIDQALALWFPGPQSETGEDVAELQLHGGHAVVSAVFAALAQIDGLRMAEAGEFTRRAFENGKLDLTAVEGLADLVMAETEGQRRQAFRQMAGALRDRSENWRTQLIQALALVEARIDFSDEADVPQDLVTPALEIARWLEGDIASVLAEGNRGERLREGFVVAIAGPPNAGKSTLLNRIARREAAIVSPYAGTTRDVIEVHLDLYGLPVTLLDTAGIRDTDDPVEIEGVRRARERAAAADLVLWIVEAGDASRHGEAGDALWSRGAIGNSVPSRGVGGGIPARAIGAGEVGRTADSEAGRIGDGQASRNGDGEVNRVTYPSPSESGLWSAESGRMPVWLIRNKIDLHQGLKQRNERNVQSKGKSERGVRVNKPLKNTANKTLTEKSENEFTSSESKFDISAKTGEGFDLLLEALGRHAEKYLAGAESALVTRARHRRALQNALAALRRALAPDLSGREDLLAEELRLAARALGRLTGRVDVDDGLDVIFRDFCIGK
jgi:tRNA modification GTPase